MEKTENGLNDVLAIFDKYHISPEKQKQIVQEGVYFIFSDMDYEGDNRVFDCSKFARFLEFCSGMANGVEANELLANTWNPKYKYLVYLFDDIDKMSKDDVKNKTR